MKLLVIQHVEFEGPAAIKRWADSKGHAIDYHRAASSTDYPNQADFDCVIIMGGPMGVNDELPWISAELAFIQAAIAAEKLMLGVCLGAQMIAKAMGAAVRKNPQREIGWYPVQSVNDNLHWLLENFPSTFTPLHWHGDTFDIPEGATHLLASPACANQAYIANDRIVGLQFHLEFDPQTARRVAEACADELEAGGEYIQNLDQILEQSHRFGEANQLMFTLLDTLEARHI